MDMERGLEGEMPSAKLREIERGIVYERVVEVERSTEILDLMLFLLLFRSSNRSSSFFE